MIHLRPIQFIFPLLIAVFIYSGEAMALDIKKIRFGAHPDKTRMVIEMDQGSEYRTFMLPEDDGKSYRLVVDLPNFNWHAGTIKRQPDTTVLGVRSGALNNSIKRIVVDLQQPAKILTAFILPADKKDSLRLVIDFASISQTQFSQTSRKTFGNLTTTNKNDLSSLIISQTKEENTRSAVLVPDRKPSAASKPVTPSQSQLYKPLIVIDAGHGGQDPGAIGSERLREKDITLSAAKTLKAKLESTGRYRVHLTRSDDTYLKLYRRVAIAREKEADLFISLHADSIGRNDVSGASIYTLSDKASDAQTAKLAQRENQADLIAGIDLSHEDKEVANILIDLAMRDTMNQSKFFANNTVTNMKEHGLKILPHTHRYAGFAVLKAPDIPSVLIEMGFMSNSKEARLLSSSVYQQKIATAITASIDNYFQKVRKNAQ